MTLDDYFASRMITTPFRLFDCDAPGRRLHRGDRVGGRARRRTSTTRWPGSRRSAPRCAAARRGTSSTTRPRWPPATPAPTSGTRTDLKPADVDVAELYDGFSFLTMTWLEALGFCGKGESGPVHRGRPAASPSTASCPLNTHGGQLSAGRLHGFGFIHEACLQLRGEAGDRQVPARTSRWPRSPTAAARSPAPAPHEARLMAFDQDDLVALPRPHRGRARGGRGPEPRHRLPPGVRRPDPRPGADRRGRRLAGQVGEVAAHPVPARGRHVEAMRYRVDQAAGRPHLRHHRDRRRAGRQGDLVGRASRCTPTRTGSTAATRRRRSARPRTPPRSTSAWCRGRRGSSAASTSPTGPPARRSSTGGCARRRVDDDARRPPGAARPRHRPHAHRHRPPPLRRHQPGRLHRHAPHRGHEPHPLVPPAVPGRRLAARSPSTARSSPTAAASAAATSSPATSWWPRSPRRPWSARSSRQG